MEKELTNKEIQELALGINGFQDAVENLDGKNQYNCHRTLKVLQPICEALDNTRDDLLDKYVEKHDVEVDKANRKQAWKRKTDENGNEKWDVTPENEEKLNEEWAQIEKRKEKVVLYQIPLSEYQEMSINTKMFLNRFYFMDHMIDESL